MLLAYASLKQWDESTEPHNIDAEKARIERIIEQFYLDASDTEYNAFVLSWIKENGRELVYTDKYTYDVDLPDDMRDTNIDLFCRKGKF